MNSLYIDDIQLGVFAFPFIAFVLTLPYAIHQYRRYGSVPPLHTFLAYGLILYLICAYFLVIMPLPNPDTFTDPHLVPQLRLFNSIGNAFYVSGFSFSNPSTWLPALHSTVMLQVLFNILLTVPLGFFARYYFRRPWWQALVFGFALSLFFELTQLSGLYGIYPHAYRLFDVDDLFCNTLGSILGYLLTIPFEGALPSLDEAAEQATLRQDSVSPVRRLVGTSIDLLLAAVIAVVLAKATLCQTDYCVPLGIAITMLFIPLVAQGRTIGQHVVRTYVVRTNDGSPATRVRMLARNAVLYFVILPMPYYLALLGTRIFIDHSSLLVYLSLDAAITLLLFVVLFIRMLRARKTGSFIMLQGRLTDTHIEALRKPEPPTQGSSGDTNLF